MTMGCAEEKEHNLAKVQVRQQALALYDAGQWSELLALAVPGTATTQPDPFLLNLAAIGQVRRGNPAQAILCWQQALHIQPDFAEAHYNFGILLENLHRLAEAEAAYRQAVRIQPDYWCTAEIRNPPSDRKGFALVGPTERFRHRLVKIRDERRDFFP
ncbi:MAG: tetratricopeptide repeat protein [Magnetococcales bacterium]|nr:tetratricopeptide repeat protein [Magnetococcales bacterium]